MAVNLPCVRCGLRGTDNLSSPRPVVHPIGWNAEGAPVFYACGPCSDALFQAAMDAAFEEDEKVFNGDPSHDARSWADLIRSNLAKIVKEAAAARAPREA